MAPGQVKSLIWKYFDIFEEDRRLAVCSLCMKKISRGGEGKKAGTTAMKNHLKNKHPEQFAIMSPDASKVTNTSGDASGSLQTSFQEIMTPKETPERKRCWAVSDSRSKIYHYSIAEMIVLDNEPFSVVERTGFTRLMKKAVPQYQMPSSSYITENILPDIHKRIHAKIEAKILQAAAVSVTADTWTCPENNLKFLTFTAHWLSPELILEHGVLSIKTFTGLYTEESIVIELNSIAEGWDIDSSKIHLLVHNVEAVRIKGSNRTEYDLVRCFIHTLQKAIDESLVSQPEVLEMVNAARQVVTYFHDSDVAQQKLREICQEIKLLDSQLVQDVSTRWISTFYLMEQLLEQKSAVLLYATDNDDLINLTEHQWELMEQCIKLLKPFEEITKVTSTGLSCISEVIPNISTLIKYLEKEETAFRSPNLSNMISSLRSELKKSFESGNYDKYVIATFLDPRFKTNFLSIAQAEKAKYTILLSALKMGYHETSIKDEFSPPAKKKYSDEDVKIEKQDSFWNCFDEVASSNSQNESSEKSSIESEIDYYLKTVRVDRKADPYKWWSENARQYPILTNFVKIYLSSPSSSIHNEELFSEPGLAYEEKRNLLLTSNAEEMLFMHYNLPLIDFNY